MPLSPAIIDFIRQRARIHDPAAQGMAEGATAGLAAGIGPDPVPEFTPEFTYTQEPFPLPNFRALTDRPTTPSPVQVAPATTTPPPAPAVSGRVLGESPTTTLTAGEEPTEAKLARARRNRDLSRSIDKLGRGIAGLGGVSPDTLPAVDTSSLDEEITRLEDIITPDERAFLAQQNIQVPKNFSRSRFMQLFPQVRLAEGLEIQREKVGAAEKQKAAQEKSFTDRELRHRIQAERTEIGRNVNLRHLKEMAQAGNRIARLTELAGDNPIAARAALVAATRAGGDVGVLTDADIARWEGIIGIPGFLTRAEQTFRGNLTPEQLEGLRAVGQEMSALASSAYGNELAGRHSSFASANASLLEGAGVDDEQLSKMLGGQLPSTTQAPAGKIRVRRKSDGKAGTLNPADFDPAKYDKI